MYEYFNEREMEVFKHMLKVNQHVDYYHYTFNAIEFASEVIQLD